MRKLEGGYRWASMLSAGFVLGIVFVGCGKASESSVTNTNSVAEIHALGFVEPATEVRRLTFEVPGVVSSCAVEPGDYVKQGAVLMRLNDQVALAGVTAAEAKIELAKANLAKLESGSLVQDVQRAEVESQLAEKEKSYALREASRIEKLSAQAIVSDTDRDRARLAAHTAILRSSLATLQLARVYSPYKDEEKRVALQEVKVAEANLNVALSVLELHTLHAPCDGQVFEVLSQTGDGVNPGPDSPVLIFGDTSNLVVRAEVDERFATQIQAGAAARISGYNLRGKSFTGRVTSVRPIMGKKTVFARAVPERMDVDVIQAIIALDGQGLLPIGLRVDVVIQASHD